MGQGSGHTGAGETGSLLVAVGLVVVEDAVGEGVASSGCFARDEVGDDAEEHGRGVVFECPVLISGSAED